MENILNIPTGKRTNLRAALRRWEVDYNYKEVIIKRIDGVKRKFVVADITEDIICKCIDKIKSHSNKRADGTCKLIENKTTIRFLKEILNTYYKEKNE